MPAVGFVSQFFTTLNREPGILNCRCERMASFRNFLIRENPCFILGYEQWCLENFWPDLVGLVPVRKLDSHL
jgi:hypothetical protein